MSEVMPPNVDHSPQSLPSKEVFHLEGRARTKPSKMRSAFSLIELLVVISIMAILGTITVPAFMQVSRSSNLTAGGDLLVDLAAQARQTALNKNTLTAIVVVAKPNLPGKQQAVALIEYDWLQHKWAQARPWERLPETVEAIDSPTNTTAATDLATPIAPLDLTLNGNAITTFQYSSFVFYPDGRLATPPSSTVNTRELLVRFSEGNKTNNYYDLVFNDDTSAVRILRP